MAISSSIGYQGTVSAVQSASWTLWHGRVPCVADANAWKPTTVSGVDRTVRIAAGLGYGYGVLDNNNANVDLQLGTLSSGATRWDAIVARRTWLPGGGTTVFQVVTGSTAKAVPTLQSAAGSGADQLIALAQVTGGVQVPTALIDCRRAMDGGTFNKDAADLLTIPQTTSVWTALTPATGMQTATASPLTGTQTPSGRTWRGLVQLRGAFSQTSGNGFPAGGTGTVLTDLVKAYWPDRVVEVPVSAEVRGSYVSLRLQIDSASSVTPGRVKVYVPEGVSDLPHWVSLDCMFAPSTSY